MKIILFGISLILLIFILNYIHFLIKNKYIIECFESNISNSILTSDIGSNSGLYSINKFSKPPIANFGQNMWINNYKISNKLFENKYKPKGLNNIPFYPKQYSMTGAFIEEGPTASNTKFV